MKLTGLFVGGIVLVAAIVVAAWASNDWLDKRGIANERGFTVEERKSHARRNQLEWDQRIQHED